MARRKKSTAGASLDSLLDTMTNVVGILVILLVVTQLGVSDAVKRIKGFVTEVSEEQLAAAMAKNEELEKLLREHGRDWEQTEATLPETKLSLNEQKELIERLKQDLARLAEANVDPEKLQELVDERRKQVAALEEKLQKEEDLLASLKAQLAETPARGPDPGAKIVNLPNPQAAPKGAEAVTFVCYGGRILPAHVEKLQDRCKQQMDKAARGFIQADGKLDCRKLQEIFEKNTVGDGYFRIGIGYYKTRKDPYMILKPREDAGEEIERIGDPRSLYRQTLRKLNPQLHWIRFRVYGDSFETYLAARAEADRHKFAAGWIPYDDGQAYTESIGFDSKIRSQIVCEGYTPPPPSKSDPDRPAPPRDDVD